MQFPYAEAAAKPIAGPGMGDVPEADTSMMNCRTPGCPRRYWHDDTFLCRRCDPRWHPERVRTCRLCPGKHYARGMCRAHYMRERAQRARCVDCEVARPVEQGRCYDCFRKARA